MTDRIKLHCLGEDVVMIVDEKNKRVAFDGWDEEAEEAWMALGGEPSPCWELARAIDDNKLDDYLIRLVDLALAIDINTNMALINAGMVEILLTLGASPNAETDEADFSSTALAIAANYGLLQAVDSLLEAGADVHDENDVAIRWATFEGHADVVKRLIEAGADLHVQGETALDNAVKEG